MLKNFVCNPKILLSYFQTFYRSLNRENLWNDPYHACSRTWKSFHAERQKDVSERARSTDAVRLTFVK
jgi:hypothetical protein